MAAIGLIGNLMKRAKGDHPTPPPVSGPRPKMGLPDIFNTEEDEEPRAPRPSYGPGPVMGPQRRGQRGDTGLDRVPSRVDLQPKPSRPFRVDDEDEGIGLDGSLKAPAEQGESREEHAAHVPPALALQPAAHEGPDLSFLEGNPAAGIIWAEILGEPRARRPYRTLRR